MAEILSNRLQMKLNKTQKWPFRVQFVIFKIKNWQILT